MSNKPLVKYRQNKLRGSDIYTLSLTVNVMRTYSRNLVRNYVKHVTLVYI